MDFKILLCVILMWVCTYSIVDRICKCIEQVTMIKNTAKYEINKLSSNVATQDIDD